MSLSSWLQSLFRRIRSFLQSIFPSGQPQPEPQPPAIPPTAHITAPTGDSPSPVLVRYSLAGPPTAAPGATADIEVRYSSDAGTPSTPRPRPPTPAARAAPASPHPWRARRTCSPGTLSPTSTSSPPRP